jgi:pimeloyl-ACP methyl ester carboxylesterase
VSVPTCVLAGERDLLVSPSSLEDLANGLPDGRGELLPQCGHLAFVTHPQFVAEKLHAFISGAC